jgi:hypothetical protein
VGKDDVVVYCHEPQFKGLMLKMQHFSMYERPKCKLSAKYARNVNFKQEVTTGAVLEIDSKQCINNGKR